jgi:DNA processing protein
VAVLAGGIKNIYPATNISLAEKIISSGGSIVSEFEDEISYPDLFLRRNRIISGLSRAVIVIEAPLKSGAIGTATWAGEQGRDVFVIPGPIGHPNYQGSHKLIRDGARLVSSPEDVLIDLGIPKPKKNNQIIGTLSKDATIIMNLLSSTQDAVPVDKIVSVTRLEPQKVMSTLTELEIAGEIIETPSGYTIAFKS